MVRGGVLAALAGTASVCAGLLCLNPRRARGEGAGDTDSRALAATIGDPARDSSRRIGPSSAEGQAGSEEVQDRARRLGIRKGLGWVVRWIAKHRPGLESTVSHGEERCADAWDPAPRMRSLVTWKAFSRPPVHPLLDVFSSDFDAGYGVLAGRGAKVANAPEGGGCSKASGGSVRCIGVVVQGFQIVTKWDV